MIVTCEQCSTQFQLDEAKVPETGTRVRCSRCRHAFFIAHPDDSAAADDLAREALGVGAGVSEETESDWQFNEDPPQRSAGARARAAIDDLLSSTQPGIGEPGIGEPGIEEAGVEGEGSIGEASDDLGPPDLETDVIAESESLGLGAGSEPELGIEGEIDRGPAADLEPGPDLDVESGPDLDLESGPHIDPAADPEEAGASLREDEDLGADLDTDLGDPDDWNFFDGGERTDPEASAEPRAVLGKIQIVKRGTPAEALPHLPSSTSLEEDEARATLRRRLATVGGALGWAATACLTLVALVSAAGPVFRAPAEPTRSQGVGALHADGVEGRWVENAVAGPLLVVSASLSDPTSQRAAAEGLVRVALLAADGRPVPSQAPALGPVQPTAALRERNPRDLRREQDVGARLLAWAPYAPGETRALQAILSEVPGEATHFRLELDRSVPRPTAAPPPAAPEEPGPLEGAP